VIVAITGASGFVGRRLAERLRTERFEVRAVSLRAEVPADALRGVNAVVHLAGEPVAQRWTEAAQRRIRESRVEGTRRLVAAMGPHRPQVLVSASAVGYYGSRGDEVLTERSAPGDDFLAKVTVAWEQEAKQAEAFGTRVAIARFGLVMGPHGGPLQKMLLPFRLGLGGPIAGGRHWMSWIHLDDLVSFVIFLLKESTVRGVFNATSPNPVSNGIFTKALAQAIHRPAVLPVPGFALRLLYGQMAEAVLASQRVMPEATISAGFTFEYTDIYGALRQILQPS